MQLVLVKPSNPDWADAPVAQRIAQGDLIALQDLMRLHNRRLYRTARSILRNDADAEEAVQEAFYLAFRAMKSFKGESSMATWLTRILVNVALQRARRLRRLSTWLDFNHDADREPAMDEFLNQPEQALRRAQTRRLIEKRIDALPDPFRVVFVLRAVEELSVEETAASLGVPPATVRSRYFRARGLLRKSLRRLDEEDLLGAFSFDGERCDRIVARVSARIAGNR